MENKHTSAISAEEIGEMQNFINQLMGKLKPHAITLSTQDRMEMPKVGPKTIKFVQDGCALAEANPQFCPEVMDVPATKTDLADFANLLPLKNTLQQALDLVTDIQMQAGSEAYQSVLAFYTYLKFLTGQNVEGAKAVYEQLKVLHPQGSRRRTAAAPEVAA